MDKNSRISWARMPFAKVFQKLIRFFGGRLLAGLILAIAALVIFGKLASEVFEGETKNFDESVRQAIHQTATPLLTQVMVFISFVGSAFILAPLGIIAALVFLRLRWRRAIVLFAVTMAGEVLLGLTLKGFYQRARPEAFFDYVLPSSYSFPSGHAMGAFCFFGILAWLITARLENLTARIAVWALAAAMIFLIGFSRIYLGVHYPSDVIAGYLAALVWTVTIAFGDFLFSRKKIQTT